MGCCEGDGQEIRGMTCANGMSARDSVPLDFEGLLADPLTRLVMASDGVTEAGLRALLERVARERIAGGCGCGEGGLGLGTGDGGPSDRDVQRG